MTESFEPVTDTLDPAHGHLPEIFSQFSEGDHGARFVVIHFRPRRIRRNADYMLLNELVPPEVVTVGVGVDQHFQGRPAKDRRHGIQHGLGVADVPQGIDQERLLSTDHKSGIRLTPGTVGNHPGVQGIAEVPQSLGIGRLLAIARFLCACWRNTAWRMRCHDSPFSGAAGR